jgi:hypothetical protein
MLYYLLTFQLAFLILVYIELNLTDFKRQRDKFIWMVIILAFGILGYFLYFSFKRKLIEKRKFLPDFKTR